jgi:hypothetical protein
MAGRCSVGHLAQHALKCRRLETIPVRLFGAIATSVASSNIMSELTAGLSQCEGLCQSEVGKRVQTSLNRAIT